MTTSPDKPLDEFDALRTVTKTLEGFSQEEQKRILRWAAEKIGITNVIADMGNANRESGTVAGDGSGGNKPVNGSMDIRTFTLLKKPKSDVQFTTVVAYYYRFEAKEEERKTSIKAKDLTDACRQVNWSRPNRPDVTLVNTANAGLLDNVGKGSYALNAVGENLVAMTLPSSSEAVANNKPSRKKKPAKPQKSSKTKK